jgi:hypothetical protein
MQRAAQHLYRSTQSQGANNLKKAKSPAEISGGAFL